MLTEWSVEVTGETLGPTRFFLFDVNGRRLVERTRRYDVPGRRELVWDGRDDAGRELAAGVYFLQCRRSDGSRSGRRVVVIP